MDPNRARVAVVRVILATGYAARAFLRCGGRFFASRRLLRAVTVFVILITFAFTRGDRSSLSPAAVDSIHHQYGLITWEVRNFLDKWAYRAWLAVPWTNSSQEHRREVLGRYLRLVTELSAAQGDLNRISATSTAGSPDMEAAQRHVDQLVAERDSLRNIVEEYLESEISKTLAEYGFGGRLLWPPVDFRLDDPPSVLVVSPRNVVRRQETILIDLRISVADMKSIENKLRSQQDVSAVVLRTGGLASYPTVISSSEDLRSLLETASHEWLHTYLFFHPLGRAFFSGGEMVTLNETLADIFGREIGRVTYNRITGEHVEPVVPPTLPQNDQPHEPGAFDFRQFMHETRIKTDEMLASGQVGGAEAYMELRRETLANEHGIYIRKINQAYFAFTGSYGESGGSVSPLPFQLWAIREKTGGISELVKAVQGISSLREFDDLLARLGVDVRDSPASSG